MSSMATYDNHVLSLYGQHNATGKRVLIKFSEQNDVNLNTLIEWNTLEEEGQDKEGIFVTILILCSPQLVVVVVV